MTTESQVQNLINDFKIKEEMEESFRNILENHTCEELDIKNKNIAISLEKVEYSKIEFDYHKFQTPIINETKTQIGYFAIVMTSNNERIDEYFVID